MYEYEKVSQNRTGSLAIFESTSRNHTAKRACIETSGVFDAKWLSSKNIASAESDGHVKFFSWHGDDSSLVPRQKLKVSNDFVLCLDKCNDRIISATSLGDIIFSSVDEVEANFMTFSTCHKYPFSDKGAEIWTIDAKKGCTSFATGGEDHRAKIWDARNMSQGPSSTISNSFSAGVCCVKFMTTNANTDIIVGCYDGYIRSFDLRLIKTPIFEINCHAGPWDIKANPVNETIVGVACMRAGFFTLNVDNLTGIHDLLEQQERVLSSYPKKHKTAEYESLAYGIDFTTYKSDKTNNSGFVGASFYDKKIVIV